MRPAIIALLVLLALPALAAPPDGTPAAPEAWLDRVGDDIRRGEYHLSRSEEGFATAPNRAHGLRGTWKQGRLELTPREDDNAWALTYELVAIGRAGSERDVAPVAHERIEHGRLEWTRGDDIEWYVNDERGVEQGFVIAARPAGDAADPLVIDSAFDGLVADASKDGVSVLLRTTDGTPALRLSGLKAWDALGRDLPSVFEVSAGIVRIAVDDRDAQYPVTVDPLLAAPSWNPAGAGDFGVSASTAGDVNGDGFNDVIVGAPLYDSGQTDEGRASVYLGSATGLATSAAWNVESNQAAAQFGASVSFAGDVNGDGYGDVIVGAPLFDNGQTDEGRAFVYMGSPTGLATSAAWTAESNQAAASFADAVANAGDINGDGFGDVLVGAPRFDNGQTDEGRAFAFMGAASGLALNAAWTAESNQASASFGDSLAAAGDVNGDGFADVIVGSPKYDNGQLDEGRAYSFRGSSTGLAIAAAWTQESNQASASFGASVAMAGDVNGDGYADILVGAPLFDNGQANEGRAHLYLGSISGTVATAAWTTESDQANASFGASVATAGDVNSDGFADVIVGAPLHDNGQVDEGRAYSYLGSATGLATIATWTAESDLASASFGMSVALAGDVDGDGYSDAIVGGRGRAWSYRGAAIPLAATEAWSTRGAQAGAALGASVASAGDVNGDGFSDVIVGAPQYDNGQADEGRAFAYLGSAAGLATSAAWSAESNQAGASFGTSVSCAGDVNGDGYSDVIVGAPSFDNGQTDEGRASVFLGSATGLAVSAAWTAESNQASSSFGSSASSAGDVNGDGYSDVVIGAPLFDQGESDEGAIFVYHGSATGLATSAAATRDSNQAGARFGTSVACAGDLDRDGFSDIAVGAPSFDNDQVDEGRVLIYRGLATGIGLGVTRSLERSNASASFGASVASAGDVNGDGFSDLVIGSPDADNGQTDEGRAFVFHGASPLSAMTLVTTVESNQASAFFGSAVGAAGDVNGDGFGDVIVGAPRFDNGQADEGRAFLFLGSGSGTATTAAWTAESNQANALFGSSVGAAGDVNGDGHGDAMVGARSQDVSLADEGRALLYYGNGGDGLDRLARLARQAGTPPIDLLDGLTQNAFQLRSNGRTPFGRGKLKLELEVKPLASAFNGTSLRKSAVSDTGAPGASGSVVPMAFNVTGVSANGVVKWRARLRSEAPFPWASHWMSTPRNGISEGDFRIFPPDLKVTVVTAPATSGAGKTITFGDTTQNAGAGPAVASTTQAWISLDDIFDSATDTLLGSRAVAALDPAATSAGSLTLTIPANWPTGTSTLFARADGLGVVTETSETNNTKSKSIVIGPDLVVNALTPPGSASSGATISIASTTRNSGGGDAPATSTGFYLSSDAVIDAGDILLGSRAVPALAPATGNSGPTSVIVPASTTPGSYFILGNADNAAVVVETNELNNTRQAAITIDCHGDTTPYCDDGNGCTDDWCDPAVGCMNDANSARCDDGSACTGCAAADGSFGDYCLDGICGGVPRSDCPGGCDPDYPWFGCVPLPDPDLPCDGLCPESRCCTNDVEGYPETCMTEFERCEWRCLHDEDPIAGAMCDPNDGFMTDCWLTPPGYGYPEVLTENPCVLRAKTTYCGMQIIDYLHFCCMATNACLVDFENCFIPTRECVPTCPLSEGWTACGNNCCPPGEICVDGECKPPCGPFAEYCPPDHVCCGGACCDLDAGEYCWLDGGVGTCLTSTICAEDEEWMSNAQYCCPSDSVCGHLENGEPAACCLPSEHCETTECGLQCVPN